MLNKGMTLGMCNTDRPRRMRVDVEDVRAAYIEVPDDTPHNQTRRVRCKDGHGGSAISLPKRGNQVSVCD